MRLVALLCLAFAFHGSDAKLQLRHRRVASDENVAGESAAPPLEKTVVIIGAGASGLAAAYTLNRHGIDYVILEASQNLGGRTQKDTTFTKYPLDIGASFIQKPNDIAKIVEPDGIQMGIPTGTDEPNFVNYTYHDFIKDYIAPKDLSKIVYGCRVTNVDYSKSPVLTTCENGQQFVSEHVIATVPLFILKHKPEMFTPMLPKDLTVDHPGWMFGGFKIAIEFKEGFNAKQICFPNIQGANGCYTTEGESYFWPISSIHEPQPNGNVIMLGYIVGKPSEQFINFKDSDKIKDRLLEIMDPKFNNMASKLYVQHKVWNWSEMADIRGAYSNLGIYEGAQNILGLNRLWIAGEAFPPKGEDNGWVDGAAFSGDDAAKQIVQLQSDGANDKDNKKDKTEFWAIVAADAELRRGN